MKNVVLIALSVLFAFPIFAQMDVVSWSFESESISDTQYKLTFTADINPGWYIYSQYLESDEGPIATSLNFTEQVGYKLVEKAEEEGTKVDGYDKIFMMNITKYKKQMVITQIIDVDNKGQELDGYVEFMTCNDDQCLPPKTVDFSFYLN